MKKICFLIIFSISAVFNLFSQSEEDFVTKIRGDKEVFVMSKFGSSKASVMLVWIHGDVSGGGAATYHFQIADRASNYLSKEKVMCVALIRPGYFDGEGNVSTGENYNRSDHYLKAYINEAGIAIERLAAHYNIKRTIIIGHSGGSVYAAVLAGMKPDIAEAFFLVSCPGDLPSWRQTRSGGSWSRSENPSDWINKINAKAKIIAITGSKDNNTLPELAKKYIEEVKKKGIDARFIPAEGSDHNSALSSTLLLKEIKILLTQ